MKLTYVIQICKSMFSIKSGIINAYFACSLTQKISKILRPMMGTFFKCILTYLYCPKYNEMNMRHSDAQKHVSYT